MRYASFLIVLIAACGGHKARKDDAGPPNGSDAPGPDASMLACANPVHGTTMAARLIGRVSGSAVLATSPPNDPRLFVLEQGGRIRIFDNEQLVSAPFLDIIVGKRLVAGGELGLLGLAFHPQYAQNGKFYIFYTATDPTGATPYLDILEQYTVSSDPNVGDKTTGTILLSIPDKYTNHNGGMLEFGSDGYLYLGTGDGGSGGDPDRNGQNTNALLAKILRIDVDHPAGGKPYGIPPTNPFADGTGGAPEVFIVGVRNPWRWSFDRGTGDLWIGDVGQMLVEELDVLPAGQQAGANLGWSMWEADHCYGNYTCTMAGMTFPKAEWWHANTLGHPDSGWRAIIGGQVYRGSCYPDIVGYYFFTDNTAATLSRGHLETDGTVTIVDQPPPTGGWPTGPSAIHADARGELYETTIDGYVYHLEAGP
jgi:glucose/arabinose dehydrogenase